METSRTVYFWGLGKNTGKSVAVCQAMREARDAKKRMAVTSVGRDGEMFDEIYKTFAKPIMSFESGDIIITSERLLLDKNCTVVRRFELPSAIGPIVAARANMPCHIEVAGPSTVDGLRTVRSWIAGAGIDIFLIDGALERKAASLPDICDGIIVSTGAAISEHMGDVLRQTQAAIEMAGMSTEDRIDGGKRIMTLPTEVLGSSLGKRGGLGKVRSKSLSLMIL